MFGGKLKAWGTWLFLAFGWLLAAAASAGAEPRIALVIGNGDYRSIAPLDNPVADGRLIGEALGAVGFDVTLLIDGDQAAMKRAVADFGRKLRAAGPDAVGLFYYAGHGVQSDEVNYLLPVDSVIHDAADLDLAGVEAGWVLRQLFSARNRTNIVILDACRNNPFPEIAGMRQGLAEMNAPPGTFIAYASAPGAVALDGAAGGHSPFTAALARGVGTPGAPVEAMFKAVRIAVVKATGGRQTPWDSSSLTSDFAFVPAAAEDPREAAAERLWETVKASGDSVQMLLFLRQYPDAKVSGEARALLEKTIAGEIGGAAAPAPAPAAPAAPAPASPPAVAQAGPSAEEQALIGRAQASGAVEDYEAYLQAYPSGTFASLADAEIRALRITDAPTAAPAPAVEAPPARPAPQPEVAAPPPVAAAGLAFATPLAGRAAAIDGRSIAQIIEGSPQYPPVEGLPEVFWKGKTCSNCHHWTQPALCDQGKTYLTQSGEFALAKQHPLDGFKQVLRDWASTGCN